MYYHRSLTRSRTTWRTTIILQTIKRKATRPFRKKNGALTPMDSLKHSTAKAINIQADCINVEINFQFYGAILA